MFGLERQEEGERGEGAEADRKEDSPSALGVPHSPHVL